MPRYQVIHAFGEYHVVDAERLEVIARCRTEGAAHAVAALRAGQDERR